MRPIYSRPMLNIKKVFLPFCLFFFCTILCVGQGDRFAVDIHHQGITKHFYSLELMEYAPWEVIEHDCASSDHKKITDDFAHYPKRSQSDLTTLAKGKVGISCVALSPIESTYLKPKSVDLLEDGTNRLACVDGIFTRTEFALKEDRNYFQELLDQIAYLQEYEEDIYELNQGEYIYKILKNRADVTETTNSPTQLGLVLTVRGGHSLATSFFVDKGIRLGSEEFDSVILKNADILKGSTPLYRGTENYLTAPVLYISLADQFYNGICGQAPILDPNQADLYEVTGLEEGFSESGKKLVDKLLSQHQGRRILIDVAQMNPKSREWYYNYVHEKRLLGDSIPIIYSHGGVSGFSWEDSRYSDQKRKQCPLNLLNDHPLNLAEEDIRAINDSEGLIGISLNKQLMVGHEFLKTMNKVEPGRSEARKFASKMILLNILTIVDIIGDESAWDRIAIGSDFDGLNECFEVYQTSEAIKHLEADMLYFLSRPTDLFDRYMAEEITSMMHGYNASQLTDKIIRENALSFIRKHIDQKSKSDFVKKSDN